MNIRLVIVTVLSALLCISCGGSSSNEQVQSSANTRSFKMGFTPWQYEATLAAQNITYSRLIAHGDVIKHHFMSGIPWQAAYDEVAYHANVEAEINGRLTQTPSNMDVFLAIDSLNSGRNGLSPDWGVSTNMPLSPPWDTRSWNSPEVIESYINFAKDLIDRFQPTHFEYGTEISELLLNDASGYNDYLVFADAVYTQLKSAYPDLQLVVSVAMKSPGSAESQSIAANIASIIAFADVVGVSIYPYAFFDHADKGDPDNLPSNWLSQITAIANGKPILISEAGWIAEDLDIPIFSYSENSDEDKQNKYVHLLLDAANTLDAELVIWWTITDFDTLWSNTLGQDPVAKIWKDIGLYSQTQQPRKALETWDEWLAKPVK